MTAGAGSGEDAGEHAHGEEFDALAAGDLGARGAVDARSPPPRAGARLR